MKSLEKQREDNRMECVKNCPPNNGSFCEKHFQIDCEFSRRIGERDMRIDDCPNCADQASIAAPGQTTLCETHNIETSVICSFCESDKAHYAQMKEFFTEEIEQIQFKSALPFCSACGTDKRVVYIGLIQTNSSGILNFSFCVDCRDQLTLKQNAARAAQERIGA